MASAKNFDPKSPNDQTDQASEQTDQTTSEQTSEQTAGPDVNDHPSVRAYVPMPAGGLRALAAQLFPDDRDHPEQMKQHLTDLLVLNSDSLRNEDSYTVGQQVRIS